MYLMVRVNVAGSHQSSLRCVRNLILWTHSSLSLSMVYYTIIHTHIFIGFAVDLVDSEDTSYDLFAVSNHIGSMVGGHYTADVKHFAFQQWFHCNDHR